MPAPRPGPTLPLTVFADHGPDGSGEPLAIMLRPGNAGSSTAAGHIEAVRLALVQLPQDLRRRVLIRADSGGGTHEFLAWLTRPGRRLHYSVGFPMTDDVQDAILKIPARAWTPAYDSDGKVRAGAWVAELTGMLNLAAWPTGMRVIVRKERPHPGAQLRITDIDGHRFTASPPNPGRPARRPGTPPPAPGPLRGPDPLRQGHRPAQPAPARLRPEPDLDRDRRPGLRTARLDPDARPARQARRWEPKRLRLRLFTAAGRIARGGRRLRLRIATRWPWATQITAAFTRLQALAPGYQH